MNPSYIIFLIIIIFIIGLIIGIFINKKDPSDNTLTDSNNISNNIDNFNNIDNLNNTDNSNNIINESNNIAIVSMMKNPKNIETWLEKHRNLGIYKFYIRLEDTPDLINYLQNQPDVDLIIGQSNGTNEYTHIQVRQHDLVNTTLKKAMNDNIKWLIQIDSDEILDGNLDEIRHLPEKTRTFWMQNVEAVYDDIPTKEGNCFNAAYFKNCQNASEKCVSYANGKGGGRVAEDVEANGPHRFKSTLADNNEIKINMRVLHYESCDYDLYKEKYIRLSKQDTKQDIPFPYYNESINAAKIMAEDGNENMMKCIFKKYRTKNNENIVCN